MPIYPPRNEPIRKKELLSKRQTELNNALLKNLPFNQLNRVVEKYRSAQLSLLKAKIHLLKEKQYQDKIALGNIEEIEQEVLFGLINQPTP